MSFVEKPQPVRSETPALKCLVWDLDNTLWHGVLAEGDQVYAPDAVVQTIGELDRRGILQSIASRNTFEDAWRALERLGLANYFVEPQISWGDKSHAIAVIRQALNIGMDAIAFVDDQAFERAEVSSRHPEVRCYEADELQALLGYPEFNPRFVTSESAQRRAMHQQDRARSQADAAAADQETFTRSLGLQMSVSLAARADLERIEELIQRTNQLNASGYIYSFEELVGFLDSPDHLLLVVQAEDRFGSYGQVGAALVETSPDAWTLKLLLVSCRVMSRGVGGLFLGEICQEAHQRGLDVFVEYRPTERNRAVLITLRFAGFVEASPLAGGGSLLRLQGPPPSAPNYVRVATPWDSP